MNAYEVKAGMVFFAGQKLCDPCLSALKWFVPCKALYKCSALPLSLPLMKLTLLTLLTAKLTLINKTECSADEANAASVEDADKFLEMEEAEEEKKIETDAAEDADNLVCHTVQRSASQCYAVLSVCLSVTQLFCDKTAAEFLLQSTLVP